MKPKFDGYAAQYDAWFMENDKLFEKGAWRYRGQAGSLRRLRQRLV